MIVTLIIVVVLALFLFITRIIFSMVFSSPSFFLRFLNNTIDNSQYEAFASRTKVLYEEFKGLPYEEVRTTSYDGLKLFGRYYKGDEDKPTAILCHGYRGEVYRDFCGGSNILFSLGWNILAIDERAHGESQGHTITFGIREKRDLQSWVDFIVKKEGDNHPIYLFGISMGGATVLMTSGLPLKGNVRGIIADCPYSSPEDIISDVMAKSGLKPAILLPLLKLSTLIWGGFSLKCESAKDAVKKSKWPILIIHGLDDRFVPDSMSREIFEENKDKVEYQTFPEAGHGLSYMVDTPRYEKIVKDFLERNL